MTLMEEIGVMKDAVDGIRAQAEKLTMILGHLVEIHECKACHGSGRNSPMVDDGCMGCNGTGVQN
jgi:DnaJ-class molecular chaperone